MGSLGGGGGTKGVPRGVNRSARQNEEEPRHEEAERGPPRLAAFLRRRRAEAPAPHRAERTVFIEAPVGAHGPAAAERESAEQDAGTDQIEADSKRVEEALSGEGAEHYRDRARPAHEYRDDGGDAPDCAPQHVQPLRAPASRRWRQATACAGSRPRPSASARAGSGTRRRGRSLPP